MKLIVTFVSDAKIVGFHKNSVSNSVILVLGCFCLVLGYLCWASWATGLQSYLCDVPTPKAGSLMSLEKGGCFSLSLLQTLIAPRWHGTVRIWGEASHPSLQTPKICMCGFLRVWEKGVILLSPWLQTLKALCVGFGVWGEEGMLLLPAPDTENHTFVRLPVPGAVLFISSMHLRSDLQTKQTYE